MYSFVLLTTMTASPLAQQLPTHPDGQRLVPVPQGTVAPYVADKPVSVETTRGDAVLYWNEVHLQAIRRDRTPPPKAARNLALVHAAIYDSVNALTRTHRALRVDARVNGAASADVAAAIAAHRTLIQLYPAQTATFDAALDASLESLPDGRDRQGGMALGLHVAEKIIGRRAADGSRRTVAYGPRPLTGVWRPTPPAYKAGLLPQWRYVKPFALPEIARFVPPPPPVLNSSAYADALNEVKVLGRREGSGRTPEQTLIALFWDDGSGSVTPPGHWNRIAQTVSRQRGLSLADNARLFALLNVSLADAAVVCWEGKFGYSYWRPITAIREADRDDNPDTAPDHAWDSLLTTPPFPSYPSGHSTFSGAAATALARFFATDAIPFRIDSDGMPGTTRSFAGFWAAAQEAGRSRIYGGIHYEFDNQEGLRCGRELTEYIAAHYFAPRGPFSAGPADRPPAQSPPAAAGR